MSRLSLSTTTKKATALLAALFLVLTMSPLVIHAAATPDSSTSQIKGEATPLYFGEGIPPEGIDNPHIRIPSGTEGLYIDMSKSIKGTDVENEFLITLQVETNSVVSNSARSDAAVVVVLDISGSMLKNQTNGGGLQNYADRRLTQAVNAINNFIDDYAIVTNLDGQPIPGERWISIVVFGSNNNAHVLRDWVNVGNKTGTQLESAKIKYIAEDTASGSLIGDVGVTPTLGIGQRTCLSQGLNFADLQLNKLADFTDKTINSINTILFTDGEPNENDGNANGTTANTHPPGYAGSQTDKNFSWAEHRAGIVKEYPSTLFTVAYSDEDHFDWLGKSIATNEACNFVGSSAPDLSRIFTVINNQISMLAKAWTITDPMGEYIQYIEKKTNNASSVSYDNKVLNWDLKEDTTVNQGMAPGVKLYTMTYLVRLDTISIAEKDWNGVLSDYFPTNKTTTLIYSFEKEAENGENIILEIGSENFLIPGVLGYRVPFSFTKLNPSATPVDGAKFRIYLGSGEAKQQYGSDVISSTGGNVDFDYLPSGHIYTLVETEAPAGLLRDDTEYVINVAYGKITFTPDDGNLSKPNDETDYGYVFTNGYYPYEPQYGRLTLSKVFSGVIPPADWNASFTVTGPNNFTSTYSYSQLPVTISGLASGNYTVSEADLNAIPGYIFVSTDGTGSYTVRTNSTTAVTITNTYTPGEEITPQDPPPTDLPDEDTPLTDIPYDDPPPTGIPPDEENLTDLEEEDAPLTMLPQTGASAVFILPAAAGLAILGAGLLLKNKKNGKDEK